jgi:glycosyltransferase involved in cell wall biosynthesis
LPRVHVICQNIMQDRVLPRMARYLRDGLGWSVSSGPDPKADAVYLLAYFEGDRLRKAWPKQPVAAYFTHREEDGGDKARCFDEMAGKVNMRIATCRLYAGALAAHGLTAQCAAPLETKRFTISHRINGRRPVIGFSGYTYGNHRKGEDLVRGLLAAPIAKRVDWRACGRGWPMPTQRLPWAQMPLFYQALDVLVVPSRVEGIPMPPLEALACGVRVVIPRNVGLLDELGDCDGVYRYPKGDLKGLLKAVEQAAFPDKPVDREALRAVTAPYSVEAWCRDNEQAVAKMLGGGNG